jgi:beta-galactosidase
VADEFSVSRTLIGFNFPDPGYMQYVEDQARKAGIVVPFINNDAWSAGHNAPGTGVGQVDVYGHNSYPLDFDCNDIGWTHGMIRDTEYKIHLNVSPSTPYAVSEFQGGVIDIWGGPGFARCGERFNHEQSRVWYKSNFAAGAKIFNVYMVREP